jgi:hypothetical protein
MVFFTLLYKTEFFTDGAAIATAELIADRTDRIGSINALVQKLLSNYIKLFLSRLTMVCSTIEFWSRSGFVK